MLLLCPRRSSCQTLETNQRVLYVETMSQMLQTRLRFMHHTMPKIAARMVSGVRGSEHITPVLEDLHWLPVSQRVVFKTALM